MLLAAGAQILRELSLPLISQTPALPTPVASFNITQLGDKADKLGKDDNFRGLTIFGNVLYYTKGSGGNGVDTVYFVDASGTNSAGQPLACPQGVGVPAASAALPSAPLTVPATLQTTGLPGNMCVLKGFNTTLAKTSTNSFPFGLWFADAKTLYVADEGDGTNAYNATSGVYTAAAASTTAGLQKWVFNAQAGAWQLAYTLQSGLNLGAPYKVSGYPAGNNAATGLPWAPATDGLRNITGRRQLRRHRDHLGDHLDGQRQRRPGRRSQQPGANQRQAVGHNLARERGVHHAAHRRIRRGPARRVVHAGHQFEQRLRGLLIEGTRDAPSRRVAVKSHGSVAFFA